ncbi:BMP and activin membrane-bound inhibitor homolog [Amphibalanus amphitrite]|uniref:BMP and activin membrane-bound inhibitor homolog n=1 Tax=Amphibalanus amphitrite TaxID=1232801 RepID=UPI001C90095E|nr:BMP and activin membrane-bound inhibitor homolog [Amphibalanus amphitrite]
MRPAGWLVVVLVRLGLAAGAPRTADERLLRAMERELSGQEAAHKVHRSHHGHRARHQPHGTLPPPAEIRCYCSLPACLTTGYMCQSMVGSCFSETVETDQRVHTRHGCLELLSRHKQRICERLHSENKADSRLRCCTEDMCNIVDDAPVSVDLDARISGPGNGSRVPLPTPPAELLSLGGGRQHQQHSQQRSGELWLRAATIAVPIAGLFILSGLVLLAVRMLRRESKPQYQYAKAPLCLEPAAGGAVGVRVGLAPAAHPATAVPVHCVVTPVDWQTDR